MGAALALALVLTACGGISRNDLEEESRRRGGGLGSTQPLAALAAIEEEQGDPVRFTNLNASLNSVTVTALVPGSDDELDLWYHSNDDLRGPEPYPEAPPANELRTQLIDPDDVALDRLDDIVDDAIETADLRDGYASSLQVTRFGAERTVIGVEVENERRSVTVRYRADGERLEVVE